MYEIHLRVATGDDVQGGRPESDVILKDGPQRVDGRIVRAEYLHPPDLPLVLVGTEQLDQASETRWRIDAPFYFTGPLKARLLVHVLLTHRPPAEKKSIDL